MLSWFPQQDAPLRFRCGYQPWGQAVSGEGVWWVVTMTQTSDWHLPVTSHDSVCQRLGHVYTCGRTYIYIYHMISKFNCKSTLSTVNATVVQAQTLFIFFWCQAPQGPGLSLAHCHSFMFNKMLVSATRWGCSVIGSALHTHRCHLQESSSNSSWDLQGNSCCTC